ncbi:MAG TPA: VPLPA-CTERM-specific exosortase XrtD [Methylophilus sp.]|nr:VPLPA-CTERM-specific exosortase XrtD [Methylophilus sp.]
MKNIMPFIKNHPKTILFAVIGLFLALAFREAVYELYVRVTTEERYSHAPLVFFMALYLIWIKRFEIKNHNEGAWVGIIIVLFSGVTLMIGELTAIWTIVQYSLLLLCLGAAWTMIGYQIKKILIPFLHLFLVIPLPYMLDVMLSGRMQLISSDLGVSIVRALGMSVYQEGNVIDLGIYKLQVVEACSGLNYMYPLMTISLMMAYMYKGPFWARSLLFFSSVPISILMNSARIAIVAILVNYYGNEAAEGFMHYFEGWVIFMLCIGLVLLEAKLLNKLLGIHPRFTDSFDYLETRHKYEDDSPISGIKRAPVVIAITVVLLAAISTLSIQRRQEIIPQRETFAAFPTQLGGWQGRPYGFQNNEDDILQLKDYLLMTYHKANTNVDVYMGYTDSQRTGFVPHSPKACVPGGGWEITDTRLETITVDSEHTFKVTRLLISKGETKQLMYYWFHQRGRDLSNEFPMKFALLYDAVKRNRTDGAIVRFTTQIYRSEAEADATLREVIRLTYPQFSRFIPN